DAHGADVTLRTSSGRGERWWRVSGAGPAPLTVALFVSVGPQGAVTLATMLIVAAPPLATVPRWHVTVPLHEPWLGVAETSVSPAGSGSSTVTLWASNGPAFDTASV